MTLSSALSSLELFCKSTLLRENYIFMFLLIRMYIGIDLLNLLTVAINSTTVILINALFLLKLNFLSP